MAKLLFENPETTDRYRALLTEQGIALPLTGDPADLGVAIDANGTPVFTVDVNNALPDETVEIILSYLIVAVNTCGGFMAKRSSDG